MTVARGVWITGPSRSGTSMTAGLFASHGVFFGDCGPGDEHNPKGYYEHPLLVRHVETGIFAGWPMDWWARLTDEGWDGSVPWGLKRGPQAWPWVRVVAPTVIVVCRRPASEIRASRLRWGKRWQGGRALKRAERQIRDILREANCPVFEVNTSGLVKGDYSRIRPAFETLGVAFDPSVADAWIDPGIWNRGKAAA